MISQAVFYRTRDTRLFVSWLSGPLFFISMLTAIAFITWICLDYDNEWNAVTKVEAAERTGCEANYDNYPNCVADDGSGNTCFYVDYSSDRQELMFPENCDKMCLNVYQKCANGFILWAGPVLMCLSMLFLSFFCTFLRTGEFWSLLGILALLHCQNLKLYPCSLMHNAMKMGLPVKKKSSTLESCGSSSFSCYGHLRLCRVLPLVLLRPSAR